MMNNKSVLSPHVAVSVHLSVCLSVTCQYIHHYATLLFIMQTVDICIKKKKVEQNIMFYDLSW